MTLIDRYLHAVRGYLPSTRRDDIIRELSEDLRAQAADREEELGRPLTDDEQEAWLRTLGHPMLLAAQYGPQRQVIGPAVFPFYLRTLKIALGGALIVHLALAVASLAGGAEPHSVIGPLASFPFGPAVTVFGWVTLTFALLDVNVPQLLKLSQWSPRTLPAVKVQDTRPRWTVFAEIVGSTFFLVWWLSVPHYPFLIFGPASDFLALAPVWTRLHLAVATIWLASLTGLWVILLRPDWKRGRLAASLVSKASGLLIAIVLFQASGLVQLAPGVEATPAALGTVKAINAGCRIGVLVWAAVAVWELARDGVRALGPTPPA